MIRGTVILFVFLSVFAGDALAHKPSDSYLALTVRGTAVEGRWDIALRDLDYAIGLDRNDDGAITWGELRSKHAAIADYAMSRLQVWGDGVPCPPHVTEQMVDSHTDGAYTVVRFVAPCSGAPTTLRVRYALFFDLDPLHRGLLRLEAEGRTRSAVFSPEQESQRFELAARQPSREFFEYVREGIWHIWRGPDHILFLLALLLPAVLRREGGRWHPVAGFRRASLNVVKIVTAFTMAHSFTLSLATLGIVSLSSRWVESAIAASVVVAAMNNVVPLFFDGRWKVAFAFGLIHGFGFASVLIDLGLPVGSRVLALVGFNLGVEAGQLVLVGLFLPVAYALRRTRVYQPVTVIAGSLAIVTLASIWLLERILTVKLLLL